MAARILKEVWALRSVILFILFPLVLVPIPVIIDTSEAKCAYVLILMAVFWTTEIIPVSVTSLLPIILFPMMGVMTAKETCGNYIKESSMLFVGGLMIACAVEHWNLHKRIALRVLLLVGTEPKWLMFGMMLPTWFLSMWISNTATTSMMLPIVQAILVQLKDSDDGHQENQDGDVNQAWEMTDVDSDTNGTAALRETNGRTDDSLQKRNGSLKTTNGEKTNGIVKSGEDMGSESTKESGTSTTSVRKLGISDEEYSRLCKAMCLCIAYAANVGGISTLIGTGPNVVLQGQAEILYARYGLESGINFGSWIIFGFPTSLICVVLTWFWLQIFYLRCRGICGCFSKRDEAQTIAVKGIIRKEYEKLGPITFAEKAVFGHFVLVAVLWLTRRPQFVSGWGDLFPAKYVGDSTAAILMATLLFIFPSSLPRIFCCRPPSYDLSGESAPAKVKPLLTWNVVHHGLPWMIVWLLGGGFALAKGCEVSGLSAWIGSQLTVFGTLQPWVMVLIITFIAAAITEVTSNTAITTIIAPILGELGLKVGVNPLYLMFPAAIATSFAFMLPVATPPNAIVFSHGHIKVKDMASTGIMLNIICVLILNLATNTWANAYFHFDVMPEAMILNVTTTLAP